MHRDTIPAECGVLTLPERRDVAGSRLISVPVIRVRATGRGTGSPIFFLNGGPGATNMRRRPPAWSRRDHDWVLVGFRGVDGSDRLDCPELLRTLKKKTGDFLSTRNNALRGEAMRACAARIQGSGTDLKGFTMHEVVDDVDAARSALGYERVHLLSESYGTRLAQIYADRHRAHVDRSVMVGVNPPGRFVFEAGQLDTLLREFGRLCAQDAWCRGRTPDLAATVSRVAHNMPKRWGMVKIDRGAVLVSAFAMLYSYESAAMIFDAFIDADAGDASGLALLSIAARRQLADGSMVFGDLYSKGIVDRESARDYNTAFDPPGSVMGSPMSALLWGPTADSLAWPIVRPADHAWTARPSDVETLLIGGNIDVSTPAVNATRELLPQLSRGHQVIFRDAGHNDLWEFQGAAYARLVGGFLATGAVDTTEFRYTPMTFRVKRKLSQLAKWSVAGIAIVLAGVIFAGWKLGPW
jgi:pimeloyl-ACP methyl ester carboxylesterase